ncbi:MAG: Gfo/Idh/MocA family protein [Bryobacteraceae bacterium]
MHHTLDRRSFFQAAALTPLSLPKKVRIGLVGLEGHSGEILRHLRSLPDCELVAAADPEEKAMARLAPSVRRYRDWREMIATEKLDVAGILGPNSERAERIVACASKKMHIVAEKPLAIERADLERVKRAVANNGVKLTMLLPMRFAGPYLAMKQIVESGRIGEVAQIDAQKSYQLGARASWMMRRATFGGSIPYIGIHMVDLMRFISGREFVETMSFQKHIGFPDYGEMENVTGSLFRLDNGGVGLLRMDYLRPAGATSHGDDRLRVAGTKGVVEFQDHTGVTLITATDKPHKIAGLPPTRSLFLDFLDSVYHGKPAGLSLADIYRVSEIVLTARESAEHRKLLRIT